MKTRTEDSGHPVLKKTFSERPKSVLDDGPNLGEGSSSQKPTQSGHVQMEKEEESWNGPKSSWREADPHLAEHLNALFPTLSFPPELAKRILTHNSHPASAYGHNAAFSFMGAL